MDTDHMVRDVFSHNMHVIKNSIAVVQLDSSDAHAQHSATGSLNGYINGELNGAAPHPPVFVEHEFSPSLDNTVSLVCYAPDIFLMLLPACASTFCGTRRMRCTHAPAALVFHFILLPVAAQCFCTRHAALFTCVCCVRALWWHVS